MFVLFIILVAGYLLYFFLKPPEQPGEEAISENISDLNLDMIRHGIPEVNRHITGNYEVPWADQLDWNEG